MAEEADATLPTAEEEAQTHAPEDLGQPGVALRTRGSLQEQRFRNRLGVEMDRLVSTWQRSTSGWPHPGNIPES